MPLALEVIATTLDDALAAEQGGAARVELVASLERGGLTPSMPLLDAVLARLGIPVRVMVRETETHEIADGAVRQRLVETARRIGDRAVDGVVFGALSVGRVDEALLDAVAQAARCRVTFHRAFEDVESPVEALATLSRHSAVDRVLCDGGAGDWPARAARLAAWTRAAGGQLQMLPGGGITEAALDVLLRTPDIHEVHVGRLVREPPTVGGAVSARRVADLVTRLRQAPATG